MGARQVREAVRGFSPAALQAARTRVGLTQRQLAVLARVGPGSIADWEAGRSAPHPPLAAALATALGISIRDLVDLDPETAALRDLRTLAGLTQVDVRSRLGKSSYGAMERGELAVPPDLVPTLSELFDVDEPTVRAAADRTSAALLESLRRRTSRESER